MNNLIILVGLFFLLENYHQANGQPEAINERQYPTVEILPREYYDDISRRTKPCPDDRDTNNKDSRSQVPRADLDKDFTNIYMKAAREHIEQEASIDKTAQNLPLEREASDSLSKKHESDPKASNLVTKHKEDAPIQDSRIDLDQEISRNYMKAAREHIEQKPSIDEAPQNVPVKKSGLIKHEPEHHLHDELKNQRIKEVLRTLKPPTRDIYLKNDHQNYFRKNFDDYDSSENEKCVQNSEEGLTGSRRSMGPLKTDIGPINYNKDRNIKPVELNEKNGESKTYGQDKTDFLSPSKGTHLSDIQGPKTMLMESKRICYACSSLVDSTCWSPDKRTTVKYCRRGNDSCLVKTYTPTKNSQKVVIRDCASSCDSDSAIKYESCNICSTDMCNKKLVNSGASAIFSYNVIALIFTAVIIKQTY